MPQDHQLTFDWILYAILFPPVVLALWDLMVNWKFAAEDRKAVDALYRDGERHVEAHLPDRAPPRAKMDSMVQDNARK